MSNLRFKEVVGSGLVRYEGLGEGSGNHWMIEWLPRLDEPSNRVVSKWHLVYYRKVEVWYSRQSHTPRYRRRDGLIVTWAEGVDALKRQAQEYNADQQALASKLFELSREERRRQRRQSPGPAALRRKF